ncbi:hypothetical protein [Allorhizocola rhizosphaerae]|uniref:hypothetical protein n=1 Tax=Allorhizocola rhizosphaerae TaxID=1872709 RepID=UPI0013C34740|nr:hypothetical protein [Allorhizocola rhizosphaerae]
MAIDVQVPASRVFARTRPVEDTITVLFGTMLVVGVLTDAWAHVNRRSTLESFFTPWHALLYSGFALLAAWTIFMGYRRRHDVAVWWRDAWPAGYKLGAVGVILFAVGGAGDMAWHTIFGIESGLEVSLSPSHLLLDLGGVLVLTSPLRSWWAAGSERARAFSGVASLALALTMASVLLMSYMPLTQAAATKAYRAGSGSPEHLTALAGVQGYLFATVLFVIPLLLCHRRRATPGVATAMVGTLSLFTLAMYQFPAPQWTALLGATLGAALVDATLLRLDTVRGPYAPLRLPIAGGMFALCVWSGHLLGLHVAAGIAWPPELWTGTLVMTIALGAALGGLATTRNQTVEVPQG